MVSPITLAAPDVNGDGIPDLAVMSATNIYVYIGKGDGTFPSPPLALSTQRSPAVAFGDFNARREARHGLLAQPDRPLLSVLPGKGDGTFGPAITSTLPSPAAGPQNDIVAADFDGDGRLDVAVTLGTTGSTAHGAVAILSGRGSGALHNAQLIPGALTSLVAADVNGDRLPDLIGYFDGLSICLGNGNATFQPCVVISNPGPGFVVADLNRDGSPDIAVVTANGIAGYLNLSQPAPPLTVVSAASFAAGALAPGSVAAAFGEGFLSGTALSSNPPHTELENITVNVQDSTGTVRPAPLFFVSAGQINFIVPAGTPCPARPA